MLTEAFETEEICQNVSSEQIEENTILQEENSIRTDSECSSAVCDSVANRLSSDVEKANHSLDELFHWSEF